MVRRAVHPSPGHLRLRDDLHVLQSLAQRVDLRSLTLVLLEHERVVVCMTQRVAFLQQSLQPRAEPGERAGLPLLLPHERFEIELAMPRLLRLPRAFFRSKALLLFLPSLSLLFLLWCGE